MVVLDEKELMALYRLLKALEDRLERTLIPVLTRIERKLYETMSIEEVERLAEASTFEHTGTNDESHDTGGIV